MRRGKSTKKNENEEVGSILHSTKSPNLSFQRIYEQGFKPRRLFVHNQGGQSTGQDAPVLVGPGDSPHECMQNVQAAKAMAKAITAIRESQEASANSSMPRLQVDRLFQSAAWRLNRWSKHGIEEMTCKDHRKQEEAALEAECRQSRPRARARQKPLWKPSRRTLRRRGRVPKEKGAKEKTGPMRMKKSLLENLAKKAPGHWTQ